MVNEYSLMSIKDDAERIKNKIKGGKLCGININDYFDDLDMMITAAYYVGRMDEVKDHLFHNTAYLNKLNKEK